MKIIHTGSFDVNTGGPAMSTYLTLKGLKNLNIDAQMLMFELSSEGKLIGDDVPIHFVPAPFERRFSYSSKYFSILNNIQNVDIYHAQGIWQYPTYALASIARKQKKPYIITLRGMLYPQDMRKSSFLKKISLFLKLSYDLRNATCIHVTCEDEMKYYRDLGFKNPVAIIPNPIDIIDRSCKKNDKIFRLGYLGRLHPRKNIESLIYAFYELKEIAKNAELIIIGGGDKKYESFLKNEVLRLGLKNVIFTGFLSGEKKNTVLESLSCMVLPSEFENLGNVILEGLIRSIPCITTKGAPWEALNINKCGWWVDYNQDAITNAVKEALTKSDFELSEMGKRGRELVIREYSIESVANKMSNLYNWILTKNEIPNFVTF